MSKSVVKRLLRCITNMFGCVEIGFAYFEVNDRLALAFQLLSLGEGFERCFGTQVCLARCELCHFFAIYSLTVWCPGSESQLNWPYEYVGLELLRIPQQGKKFLPAPEACQQAVRLCRA